jgi:tetratricopeptide (TPR) repeat protein
MKSAHTSANDMIRSAILSFLITPVLVLCIAAAASLSQENPAAANLAKARSYAESQHEIVMILLQKKQFDQAVVEANKIFEMKWPADQEALLLKELRNISDNFVHAGQPAMAIRLLDDNTKSFKSNAVRAAIWKEKGYIYKSMKENDKALECFREAQRLDK